MTDTIDPVGPPEHQRAAAAVSLMNEPPSDRRTAAASAAKDPGPRMPRGTVRAVRRIAGVGPVTPLGPTVRQLQHALARAHQKRLEAVLAFERQAALMAVLAHELRAPLSPIRSAAALLGASCTPELNRFVGGLLERQTTRASRLVNDLLDVAHIRTGKLRLERALVDLAEVVAAAAETCRPGMVAKCQVLTLEVPAQPVWVDGDAMRLVQVLNNLLNNASRYTPSGGDIRLGLRSDARQATVVVSDTGIGIAAPDLHRIFDPYFRHELAAGLDATGMGLGLSIVRELVLAHGGHVAARSDGPGCGSRFEMNLGLLPVRDLVPAPLLDPAAG